MQLEYAPVMTLELGSTRLSVETMFRRDAATEFEVSLRPLVGVVGPYIFLFALQTVGPASLMALIPVCP